MDEKQLSNGHRILQKQFGYNFWYVADLYESYLADQASVSDFWQNYFNNLSDENGSRKEDSASVKESSGSAQEALPKARGKVDKTPEPKGSKIQDKAPRSSFNEGNENYNLITGVGSKIIENMTGSLAIPTATSQRAISVKLLEENRRIINQFLKKTGRGRISFTHIVAYAIVRALKSYPSMNNSYAEIDGYPYLVTKGGVNLGLAIDIERKDGSRSLIVPNIKKAEEMSFARFFESYDDVVNRARKGKIEPSDFQGTTISLTNPGTVGTVSSIPRLMTGQGVIIAVGVIDYPAQYQAMSRNTIAALGIGKVMNITSTYDHRVIQGAESGLFLKEINELLLGEKGFYDEIFSDIGIPQHPVNYNEDTVSKYPSSMPVSMGSDSVEKQARILQLINIYRVRGHLLANFNPLGCEPVYYPELDPATYGLTIWDYDRTFITGGLGGKDLATLREILDILQQTYCDKIGAEYMHIQNPEEKAWLQSVMEPVQNMNSFDQEHKKRILWKLVTAEIFEVFLHTRFIGHKRFSLEGSETIIPVLDYLINIASDANVEEIYMGLAHRGRLNVLANIIGKSYENIFAEFEGNIDPNSVQGSGDVKYHLGASGTYKTRNGRDVRVSVASNPSHLEWVNPVVEGIVRAKQTRSEDKDRNRIIPVLIHGDAAFAGQGVVAETINLSQLKGYRTGGTVHIIINNQIGFTTNPDEARSSIYASDVAKMVQAPIFHVNGDDPEASLWTVKVAFGYRQKFGKDVVIDLFGYRKHGHNEGDDPAYTQPVMYRKIKNHRSVKEIYRDRLIKEKIITPEDYRQMEDAVTTCLNDSWSASQNQKFDFKTDIPLAVPEDEITKESGDGSTYAEKDLLIEVTDGMTSLPENFSINPKLKKILEKRREIVRKDSKEIDWAFAEALAFGSLLMEGTPVRLSGQDSVRGTFSQRHLMLSDINSGNEVLILDAISGKKAKLEALDSLLSEAAVLGFEYGYSIADPLTLVLWEAQFGDFANSAQVIIDNFIVSGNSKWGLPNNIVMLLPHGFEGQGPEHSSARLERFLTLCAEDNMFVCNLTTPSQYFHLLRRHIKQRKNRPLVLMTPKSLLRLPEARSAVGDFTQGAFMEVIDDHLNDNSSIKKLVMVSGKLYYELDKFRKDNNITDAAIIRLEQFYPFPAERINEIIKGYPALEGIVWAQEEPKNMGGWGFIFQRMHELLNGNSKVKGKIRVKYAGRTASSSPASGSLKVHQQEQEKLIKEAFS